MDHRTVARSTLPWAELQDPAHRRVLETYRALIALRRANPDLADPRLDRFEVRTEDGCLILHRGRHRVLVNLGPDEAKVLLDLQPGDPLLALGEVEVTGQHVRLPADSFAVF